MDWSRIPSLSSLRAFEAAARHQSLTKAAAELNVTHAAIAQHVRGLEAEFAQTLFTREGRGIVLTDVGRQLAAGLNTGFSEIAVAVEDVKAEAEGRALNLTLTPAFAMNWLMPRIGDFWSRYPDVSININPSTQRVDLRADGFDVGIRYGTGSWTGLEARLLTGSEFWVVAHPDLMKGRSCDCLQDVQDLPWLMEEHMMELRTAAQQAGVDLETVNLKMLRSNSIAKSGVLAGLGVGLQPRSLVEDDVVEGKLTKICELKQEGLGYYTVVVPGRQPKGLKEFLKWLHEMSERPSIEFP